MGGTSGASLDRSADSRPTFYGSVVIRCPADTAWDVLRDFSRYHKWNTFTPKVTFSSDHPTNGDRGTLRLTLANRIPSTTSAIRMISMNEETRTIEWLGVGPPQWLLLAKRVQRVEEIDGENCRFISCETMTGPLSWIVKLLLGENLTTGNQRMGEDLRRWIEQGV